jgi:hypothetical protein
VLQPHFNHALIHVHLVHLELQQSHVAKLTIAIRFQRPQQPKKLQQLQQLQQQQQQQLWEL